MSEEDPEQWVLRRTDDSARRYLSIHNDWFVWVWHPENAVGFHSQDHAETIRESLKVQAEIVRKNDAIEDSKNA